MPRTMSRTAKSDTLSPGRAAALRLRLEELRQERERERADKDNVIADPTEAALRLREKAPRVKSCRIN
jgi:hypothetical protein